MIVKALLHFFLPLNTLFTASASAASQPPGYSPNVPSTITNNSFTFGANYAVLNLDLINGLVGSVNATKEGKRWIRCTRKWIDAVHKKNPPPLSIYTRIYFSTPWRAEVPPYIPFASVVESLGNITVDSPESQVYTAFAPREQEQDAKSAGAGSGKGRSRSRDVELRKSRYYAGDGNALEEILGSWGVDTVVLSGIRTSGVILSTVYRLFDLNFKVYVISNNTIETSAHAQAINDIVLQGFLPKLPVEVISVEQAIAALGGSG